MAKSKRMFNSNLVNASSFKMKVSNKAKLLYFYIMLNADDKGFCDNADEIIVLLDSNDREFHNEASLDLLEHGYRNAIQELLDKHMLIMFVNKYGDKVYLVRQWYLHNQIPKDRVTETTYTKYLEQVEINSENEYDLKEYKPTEKMSENVDIEPSTSKNEENSDDEESNELKIPDVWDSDSCSIALEIHTKKLRGQSISEQEKKYLNAYEKSLRKNKE